ncbi:unnamed protein product [Symbiodinium sp. CCMP2592]|nr:unnamed protein product [Symbiodinium sp. CCMP2592]
MSLLKSEAAFEELATECGLSSAQLLILKGKGVSTMSSLAYAVTTPGVQPTELALRQLLDTATPEAVSVGALSSIRRCVFECQTCVVQQLKLSVEGHEGDKKYDLPPAERTSRIAAQKTRLVGFELTGAMECAYSCYTLVGSMLEADSPIYLEPHRFITRQQEVCREKPKREIVLDGGTKLTVRDQQSRDRCQITNELQLWQALTRRSLACDLMGAISFQVQESWHRFLFDRMAQPPPPRCSKVSMEQLLRADRQAWVQLAETVKTLKRDSAGVLPLDAAFPGLRTDPAVLFNLLPLRSPDPPQKIPNPDRGNGKGLDKGIKRDSEGQPRKESQLPDALKNIPNLKKKTSKGKRLCWAYNIKDRGCSHAEAGKACRFGLHLCMRCEKPHPQFECPAASVDASAEVKHPAEEFSLGVLTSGTAPSRKDVLHLSTLLPFDAPQPSRDLGSAGQSWTTGLYTKGGITALRSNVKSFPFSSSLLFAFIRAISPSFECTSAALFVDSQTALHRDSYNAHLPNLLIGVNSFSGGQLWLEGEGPHPMTDPSGAQLHGQLHEVSLSHLTFEAWKNSFAINRHPRNTRAPVVPLDLSTDSGISLLRDILSKDNVVAVHMSPPSNFSDLAVSIYTECCANGLLCCLDAPCSSNLWKLRDLRGACPQISTHYSPCFVHDGLCQHRRLIHNFPALSSLSFPCGGGCKPPNPALPLSSSPGQLCAMVARAFAVELQHQGAQFPAAELQELGLPLARAAQVASGKQPKGKRVPPLVSEYKSIITVTGPSCAMPPKQLSEDWAIPDKVLCKPSLKRLPKTAKLIRTVPSAGGPCSATRELGSDSSGLAPSSPVDDSLKPGALLDACSKPGDGHSLAAVPHEERTYGIAWTPEEFVKQARGALHPKRIENGVPKILKETIVRCAQESPADLARERTATLRRWMLTSEEAASRADPSDMPDHCAAVLGKKSMKVFKSLLTEAEYPDTTLTKVSAASLTVEDVRAATPLARKAILTSTREGFDREVAESVYQLTKDELAKGKTNFVGAFEVQDPALNQGDESAPFDSRAVAFHADRALAPSAGSRADGRFFQLRSKALDANRKCALKKWVTLVSLDFNAWGVAKQAMGPFDPKFATGGLVESVQDCLADKATATLHQRVGPIFRYVHFWKLQFVVCLPVREHQLYDYFKANPNAAPTSFRSLLIAFSFAKHLLGLIVLDEALSSGPALTVEQVKRLEALVLSLLLARPMAGGQDFRLRSQVEDKSLIIYARDSPAAPLRELDRVIDEIAAGRFKPDLTRSGMIANLVDPQLPPEHEEEADAISSSSSEASDDEEEAPVSDEEQALEQIAGQWGPEPGDGPWARHKQTRFLHKVRDEARAKDIGVSDQSFAKLEAEGLTTMATFAFCCHFNPSATDEKPLTDLVTKVLGAAPSLKEMSCFRRLFAEAYATVASDIRAQVEATEDSSIKKLAPADRAERLREQQARLKGLDLRGNMEPGDSLIDRAVAIYESDRLQYVEWQHSVSRQHELLTGLKKDASLTLDSAGGLKIASKPNASIMAYHLHDELLEKYMSFRLTDPPPNHARVSLKQIEQADRQFTLLLAEHTRSGIKVKAGGSRPCDDAFRKVFESTEFLSMLTPRPLAAGSGASRDASSGDEPPIKRHKGNGKGVGRGRGGKGAGKGSTNARVPAELLALGCVAAMPKGAFVVTNESDERARPTIAIGARWAAKLDDAYAFCESLASHFLQSSDFSATNIASILDAFPSEDHTRTWLEADGDSKAITVGACNRGGVTAVRSNTRRMPAVAKYLAACVKLVAPKCEFTSVSVHRNLQAPMHQDSFNSSVPNVIVPLSSFAGGHIFVVHPEGPDQTTYEDVPWTGFKLDCASHAWAFDAKHCKHFTLPWKGSRSLLVAFTVTICGVHKRPPIRRHWLSRVRPSPSAELPADGPLVIELCAGSAILSQTAACRGFAIMPVDHAHNRHAPMCKIVNLDLTKSHSWEVLKFVIKSRRVVMVFAAPPCGTCSAARNYRPGPPVLRTTSHPWGVPWASTRDCVKLKAANAIYKHLCAFLAMCDQHSVPWCVENPTNSMFWELPCLAYPLAHGFFAHCQACAFGSERDKKTSFLCNSSCISRMALMCPGCKQHASWGQTSSATFATAEEAAYPPAMCQALCDVFESEAARLNYTLGSAHPVLARAHKQPRGRLHPQLLSEHSAILSRLLPQAPTLNYKRCLKHDVHGVPAGSKLLRSENRGSKGVFCVFGVFRSPESFVREAKLLHHPFDSLAQLPDYLIKSLFEQITKSPAEICKLRLLRLQRWRARATELAPVEHAHRAKMQPSVREILANKRTALLEEMAAEIDWPDKGLFSEMRQGFRLVGCLSPSGVFREGGYLASISESELMENADSIKDSLLSRVSSDPLDENADELYDVTLQESTQKKWLEGPMSPEDIGKRLGAWIPVRRFCVVQKGRLRPIHDFKENLVNQACSTSERIVLQAMDHLLWSLSVLCHFYRKRGAVDFTLSSGERLTGHVHPDWQKSGASMQVATLDLKSAYKQLPLSPCDFDKSVVTLKDPKTGSISCFVMRTLPFGALASVYHFLRVSLLLHALGCHLGACWSAYFDDFPMATHSLVATSTSALVKGFLKLAGFDFADEKCTPFSADVEVLGVTLDVSQSTEGLINIRNKPSRCEELNAVIEEVLRDKSIVPCRLPSFIGKLQFADGQIWGRAGRMALRDLRTLGFTSRVPVSLDASGIDALKILQQRLMHGKPRVIRAGWKEKPILLFTDGALEDDNPDHGPATVGAVMFKPDEPNVYAFGCEVPTDVLSHWRSDGRHHVIGLVELYGAVLALRHWRKHLDGRRVILFIDNWPALDTLVKGDASLEMWREILMIIENPQEASPCFLWIARVPSASNIADSPSRGSLSELSHWPLLVEVPKCPLSKVALKSIVSSC